MAVFDKPRSKPRRVDPRKVRGDGWSARLQRSLSEPGSLARLAILALLVASALLLMFAPGEPLPYREGDVAQENIFPRVAFSYTDVEATKAAQREASLKTPNVYVRDTTQTTQLANEFMSILEAAALAVRPPEPEPLPEVAPPGTPPPGGEGPAGAATAPDDAPDSPEDQPTDPPGPAATGEPSEVSIVEVPAELETPAAVEQWQLGQGYESIKRLVRQGKLDDLRTAFQKVLDWVSSRLILNSTQHHIEREGHARRGILVYTEDETGSAFHHYPTDNLLNATSTIDREQFRTDLMKQVVQAFDGTGLSRSVQEAMVDRITRTLSLNLRFDPKLTERKREEEAAKVPDKVLEYSRTTLIVPRGEIITGDQMAILEAAHKAYVEDLTWLSRTRAVVGSTILLGLILFVLAGYTALFEPNVLARPVRAFVLVALLVVVMIVARFFSAHLQRSMLIFPVTTAAMIITVAYHRRFAIFFSWAMVLLVALVTRLADYDVVLLLLVGTAAAVFQLGEIRSRSKLIRVGFLTGLVYLVAVWAQEFVRIGQWTPDVVRATLERSGLAFIAGVFPGFIILGILPFIERVFNIVTSIKLLELCDANQPALRKLAIEAPGTYSHSLLLGSLVEPACEAIGADGLLARVGAYFHDIGKVNKPRYFTENQSQLPDGDHSKLTPRMSKLIITSHIKDGLDMARQFALPKAVNAFIAEHHGTTVIQYFYHEAKKSAEVDVEDTEFRYPGPKPQSKETAVLMLADSCEGAVRAIKEPTPPKIEDRVHAMVMTRLLDGQLDESGMTLQDVRKVEQSLTKSLISVHHGRVAYPADEQAKRDGAGAAPAEPSRREAPAADKPQKQEPRQADA